LKSLPVGVGNFSTAARRLSPPSRLSIPPPVPFWSERIGVGNKNLSCAVTGSSSLIVPAFARWESCKDFLPLVSALWVAPQVASIFVGVGNERMACSRVLPPPRSMDPFPRGPFAAREPSGVGNDPDAGSPVPGTKVGSSKHVPFRVIPDRGKVLNDNVESSLSQEGDVLDDDEEGSELIDQPEELGPETRTRAREARARPRRGTHVLTRKATTEQIARREVRRRGGPHISMPVRVRPMLRQHPTPPRIQLHLEDRLEPAPLEPQIEAADAREQATDAERRVH
jgi:hypothetical protein